MAARRLAGSVTVTNPRTHKVVTLRPGDEVPAWAEKLITNPAAWAEVSGDVDETASPGADTQGDGSGDGAPAGEGAGAATASADGDGDSADGATGEDGADGGEPAGDTSRALEQPPRAGRGSSAEAWQDYADAIGVEYAQGASRDDIVAAVDEAAK